jgi:HSP20 family protein
MDMANQMSNWEPLTMRDAMERFFDEGFMPPMRGRLGRWMREREGGVYRLPVDAYTTEDAVVIEAAIPGVDPDKVDITVDGDVVTISAEIPSSPTEGRTYAISERFSGTLRRSLNLNVPVEAGKAEASFENGVLTLRLPKSEEIKPKKITVQSK